MENSRFLKIVIIILLLINISTLAFMWMHKGPHGMPPPRQEIGDFLMRELNFTDTQRNQYEKMRDEHRSSVRNLRDRSRELHDDFFELLGTIPIDSIKANQLADSITIIQKQIELSTFYHFQQVRSNCTAEQQKKFDEVINDALIMMAPPPPPHR